VTYLTPTKDHWACDVEADGLLDTVTQIWCVVVYNCVTKEKASFTDAASFKKWLEDNQGCILVGHNFIAYDLVVLNRLWGSSGVRIPVSRVVDTFVLSQLYNPSMPRPHGLTKSEGPHSLKAWGLRLKYPKSEHNDFSQYSPEMLRYCTRDTILTAYLFRKLSARMGDCGFTERGAEIEHLAWNIIQNKQRKNGFPLDKQRAEELYAKLQDRLEELKNDIYKLWPPQFVEVRRFAKARKANGEHTANYVKHRGQFPTLRENPDGGYSAYDWVEFNLGSPAQRVEKLLELGWQPVSFTPKTDKGGGGNPKVDEDSLVAFAEQSGKSEVVALAKWVVLNSRANMIRTWLNAYNEETGAIHGRLFIASTLRYRHTDPNSANIPAVRLKKDEHGDEHIQFGEDGYYTYECRDLWTCGDPADWVLVGLDGTGIQNRCLVHHLIETVGEEEVAPFKALSLSGDIHKHNINVLGLANKAAAKKFYYTLMMGGAGARLAADQLQFGTKMTAAEGSAKKTMLVKSIPGFKKLIDKLEKELEKTGRIRLCDGTPILVPSPHMVIPYLLQGDESRLMKQSMIYLEQELSRAKISAEARKVADIHDEWQYRVRRNLVEEFIRLALPVFKRAGRSFGYKIEIEGDAKVGLTWAETH
jgi:DNA polymerase-1